VTLIVSKKYKNLISQFLLICTGEVRICD